MNYLIDDTTLSGIADAIRNKTGDSAQMDVSDMASEIESIITEPAQIEKSITANGEYKASDDNTYGYSKVTVDVPLPENGYLLKDLSGLPDDEATVSGASALPLAELKAEIAPTQTGTPWWAAEDEKTPYLFRPSPQLGNAYNHENDKIVGASVAWNQLIANNAKSGTITPDGTKDYASKIIFSSVANHVMVYRFKLKYNGTTPITSVWVMTGVNPPVYARYAKTTTYINDINDGKTIDFIYISKPSNDWKSSRFGYTSSNTLLTTDTMDYDDVQHYDLALMFGQAIADYIYSLEQSEAGSGIAWLKSHGFFTKDYYPYDAGGIASVQTSAKKTVGFNQWDEEYTVSGSYVYSSYIMTIPNTTYYIKCPSICSVYYYDNNKTLLQTASGKKDTTFITPSDCGYIRFSYAGTTYNHDISINLHWDGERDGEYEAYEEHTYSLDSDLELRGIPKLDSANKLYYDGDTYESDGTVTRKYGIVDLGTLNWTLYSNTPKCFGITGGFPQFKINGGLLLAGYVTLSGGNYSAHTDELSIWPSATSATIYICDSRYADATEFKSAMNGVYLVYELATPTPESADTYTNPQIVSNWGTEEFVDERTVPVPVGHETRYYNEAPIVGFTEMVITRSSGADSKTYTVDLNGTVYGGVLDVVKGELTITYGIVDLGTLNWSYNDSMKLFISDLSMPKYEDTSIAKIMTTKYVTTYYGNIYYDKTIDKLISARGKVSSAGIAIRDLSYTNAATFKTSLSGTYLVYELATSTTVTLTPTAVATLLGSNTLTASTGDIVSVKYFSKE